MLSFPVRAQAGSLATTAGPAAVADRIALLLGTPQGSRSLVPEYGCPPPPLMAADVQGFSQELRDALARFVPDARQVRVRAALEGGRTVVDIAFQYAQEEVSREYVIAGVD